MQWLSLGISYVNQSDDALYYTSMVDTSSLKVCDGQGADLLSCNGFQEHCVASNNSIGSEGSCLCLSGSAPSDASHLSTPYGCCFNCSLSDRACLQGQCTCLPPLLALAGAGQRNGSLLVCASAPLSTTTTSFFSPSSSITSAPASTSRSGVWSAVVALGVVAALAALLLLVWAVYRWRRRRQMAKFVNISPSHATDQWTPPPSISSSSSSSSSSSKSRLTPFPSSNAPPSDHYAAYDDYDGSSVHDFL